MVSREEIDKLINPRLSRVLLIAESSLPSGQFQAFRKLVLDEFGKGGLGKELDQIFGSKFHRNR